MMIVKGFSFFFPWLIFKNDQAFITGKSLVFLLVHLGSDITFLEYLERFNMEEKFMYMVSQAGFPPEHSALLR